MRKIDTIQNELLAYLEENSTKSYSVKQLSEALGYDDSASFKQFVKAVAILEENEKIAMNRNGQFRMKTNRQTVTGKFRSNERGFGFVEYDENEADIFIPRGQTASAMEGDQVEVQITGAPEPWNNRGAEGKVINVLERRTPRLVGEFFPYDSDKREQTGYLGYIVPQGDLNQMILYVLPEGVHPVEGSICLTEISEYPSATDPVSMKGYVVKEIGHKNAPGVDILSILYKLNIPTEFPEDAIQQAEDVSFDIPAEELAKRRDLRSERIVTIDGADAKDLDDAISLRLLENGNYHLGVHIADVSYYVRENSPIDREAFLRGTSVYLTDRVVPMLPQKLSNGICSLLPNEERLTMSCEMEIDPAGEVVRYDIFPSVIVNKQRMTYDAVNAILMDRDRETRDEYEDFLDMFEHMAELHKILERKRKSRGAIDFDTHEAKIMVDEEGHPTDIKVIERGIGERLIESFMLSANETIAHNFDRKKLPFIYRIHEQPDPTKMLRFMEFVTTFGIMVPGTSETITPKQLQKVIQETADESYSAVVATMLLRSMKQAKYDPNPIGHYGLATKDYTHFTSPIRRYPDLIVHRLIRAYGSSSDMEETKAKWEDNLSEIAIQSSVTERRAVDAERETDALKKAEFMLDKVGEQYDGVISSVLKFGIFVELPNTVEGLVHISNMDQDYFNYIESHMVLIGERTGVVYRIGQKVKVEVTNVDLESRKIDFKLLPDPDNAIHESELTLDTKSKKKKGDSRKREGKQGASKGRPTGKTSASSKEPVKRPRAKKGGRRPANKDKKK